MAETKPPATKDIFPAFLALQEDLDNIEFVKNATGSTGNREYKYQDLPALAEAINPTLRKHKFAWSTRPSVMDGQPSLRYALVYAPTGQSIEGEMLLMSKSASPQDQGSAITYARRYSVTAVLDIVADEDDDASRAQRTAKDKEKAAKQVVTTQRTSEIYMMLATAGFDPDEYEKALGKKVAELTGAEADEVTAKLGAYINRERAKAAAAKRAETQPAQVPEAV